MYSVYTRIIKSTVRTVLLLFLISSKLHAGMPLTETIHTLPEEKIELFVQGSMLEVDDWYLRNNYTLGLGILTDLSIWYSVDYIHESFDEDASQTGMGDSFVTLWYFIGEYAGQSMATGFQIRFRIPTGVDVYTDPSWANLSLGNNEVRLGPVSEIRMGWVYLHTNFFYTFRQARGEDFYEHISLDITDSAHYKKMFGFNPASDDTFLSKDRYGNDIVSASIAINTDYFYPLIPYGELYASRRMGRKKSDEVDLPVEGIAVNPVFVSMGIRYFISSPYYLGLYWIESLRKREGFVRRILGCQLSLIF